VGQMLRQGRGLCGKIICTKAVLLIIRVHIIWINLRNERTCYLIYWTALIFGKLPSFLNFYLIPINLEGGEMTGLHPPACVQHGYEGNFSKQTSASLDLLHLQHSDSCQSAEQESGIPWVMCSLSVGHTGLLVHTAVASTPPRV
jgi:hypothetical protein